MFWNEEQQKRRRRVGVTNWQLSGAAQANLADMQRQAEIEQYMKDRETEK